MADGSTTTYSFTLPEVGASEDSWGTKLNSNWTLTDQLLDGTTAIAPNLTEGSWEISGTAITANAAEINLLDGVTSTTAELSIVDGDTAATATTLVDADRIVINDDGTMVQVAMTDVQTYVTANLDADILKADVEDTITAPMRGFITDNSASLTFDLTATNNFKAAVSTGTPALTFTGMASASGQSGNIYINNTGATISAAASTVINSADLTTINVGGRYWLSYYCDGTDVYVTSSTTLTDQGV